MSIPLQNADNAQTVTLQKPDWFKIRPGHRAFSSVTKTIHDLGLVTVCEEAHCPNQSECWSGGTATFMVLGDTCTRGCRFCAVKTRAKGQPVDAQEPQKLAQAIQAFGLGYAVITSVDRDDLPDQGAAHFAACISEIKSKTGILVEVLTPDFRGHTDLVDVILAARPDVFAHNVETVRRLQKKVRDPRAGYDQSLSILRHVKRASPQTITKSSLMLGLGEKPGEVHQALDDLRAAGCDVVTLGQYLRPSSLHVPLVEYVPPDVFAAYRDAALQKGFLYCASGPLVRSSYKAGEFFLKNVLAAQKPKVKPG